MWESYFMNTISNYENAVKEIKETILKSQYEALKTINEKQLLLYYSIGKYISLNTRKGFWGKNALEAISIRLQNELPGLRGFSARHLRYMRTFYEEWSFLGESQDIVGNMPNVIWQPRFPNSNIVNIENFLSLGFSFHIIILSKIKELDKRIFYINKCVSEQLSKRQLIRLIENNFFDRKGQITNNFGLTIKDSNYALKAINSFKDSYLLDFVNTEELIVRDKQDIDEKVLENGIIHNIKKFILEFGDGFAFIRNQFRLDAFGEDQYIDLLFFNRTLNCLVAIELKTGKFKTSYLGQLSGYLSILDKFERKQHENPSVGIILCKDMNKTFVDFVIRDYTKPMGVATYKTSKEMSDDLKKALPDIDELRRLIDKEDT